MCIRDRLIMLSASINSALIENPGVQSFLVRNNRFDEAKNTFQQIKTTWKEANQLH